MKRRTVVLLGLALAGLPFATAVRGEDPKPKATQRVDAGGLTFEAPASWKASKPSSRMRRAQLTVPPSGGDRAPGELVVFAFPGGAGTVEANVARWRDQFKDDQGEAPKVESSEVKGRGVDVTRVEVAGSYTDPFAGGGTKTGYRLLGAIVETRDVAYFLKLVGPDKTIKGAEDDFDALLKTIATGK